MSALLDDPAAPPDDVAETVDGDHGRIEIRRAEIVHDVAWLAEAHDWPGLAAVGKLTASREADGKATTTTRHDLLSRPLPAARFAKLVRTHWHIENRLHWVRDVVMDEDQSRAQGSCPGKPRPPAPLRAQPAPYPPRQGLNPRQD
jgi:hypothetical protein